MAFEIPDLDLSFLDGDFGFDSGFDIGGGLDSGSFDFLDIPSMPEFDFDLGGDFNIDPNTFDGSSFLDDFLPSTEEVGDAVFSSKGLGGLLAGLAALQQGKQADKANRQNQQQFEQELALRLTPEQQLANNQANRDVQLQVAGMQASAAAAAAGEQRRRTAMDALIRGMEARQQALAGRPEILNDAGQGAADAAREAGEAASTGFSRLVQGVKAGRTQ